MKTKLGFFFRLSLILLPIFLVLSFAACGECEHEWGEWAVKTAPSCEAAGERVRTCAQCEETQTEAIAALSHEFLTYASNNDASCVKNATETATCTRCAATDTREIANSKNPTAHASTETRYQPSGTDAEKHDKVHACCNAIIETVAHRWNDGAPDPNEQGVTVYTCTDCGATKKLGGAGHTHAATKMSAHAAGCQTFGNIEYWYCAGCETYFADEALTTEISEQDTRIPPSHTGGTATCNARAICTRCQEPYGSLNPANHAGTGTQFVPHPTDASKHHKKLTCCGAIVETADHRNDSGRVDGSVTVYTCQDCRKETRVPIVGHTHTPTHVPARGASCTVAGNLEHWYCTSCHKYFSDAALTREVTEQSVTVAPAHTSNEFTYAVNATDPTKHDKKYACCGTVAQTVAHEFALSFAYAATCEANGYNLYTCICGAENTEYTSPAKGHSVDEWVLDLEAPKTGVQCTFVQTWTGTCFTCREEVEREMEIVRHSYIATVTVSPTCKTEGEKTYACACGATPDPETVTVEIDPNAHAWDGGVTANGITTYNCTNQGCDATKTSVVSSAPTETLDKSVLEENEVVLNENIALKLDSTLLGKLDGASQVTVTANPVSGGTRDELIAALPEALRGQITAETPIMDFALTQNGGDVDFDGGKIHITMKYTLPAGADADCVAVWYVDSQGSLSYYPATYYEVGEGAEKQGFVSFDAAHFSTYLPGIAPSENACELYEHNWITNVVAPTCTSRGYTEYHCQRCGESMIDDILYALGHAYETTEMVPSTCLEHGSRTQICTREDCDYENTMELPLAAHRLEYDREKSTPVTCTQDGVEIRSCTVQGCDYFEEDRRIDAWGHLNFSPVSAALATGAAKCTDGVVITYQCGNEYDTANGYVRCPHTETETVYEHINEYDFGDNKFDSQYDPREPQRIMLGSYLTAAGIAYNEEPYLEITAGCLCGEARGEIRLFGGTGMYGEIFSGIYGMETVFRAEDAPQPGNALYDRVYTATSSTYVPGQGMVESNWSICFRQKLAKDGCNYRYSVEIGFGYNSESNVSASTQEILLATYKVHKYPLMETITLDDPSKTCFENCPVVDSILHYGIHVTRTCSECQEIIEQFDTAVNTSSSHYYSSNVEVYEGDHGFKAYIRTCPCGAVRVDRGSMNHYGGGDSAGVQSVLQGDYHFSQERKQIEGGELYILTGTCEGDTFIYAYERLTIYRDCRVIYTDILYLGCADAENYRSCDKVVDCGTASSHVHHDEKTETVDTPVEGYPCCIRHVVTKTCKDCSKVTYYDESIVNEHVPVETTVTDKKGNVTATAYCETCGYLSIEVKDANGNTLRTYLERDYVMNGMVDWIEYGTMLWEVSITTYVEVEGMFTPDLQRMEYYEDATKENCLAWGEQTVQYSYRTEEGKGCFLVISSAMSNSLGEFMYAEDEINCCRFGEVESQEATCQQQGWLRQTCQNCGYVNYIDGPYEGYHHVSVYEYQDRTCLQDGYGRGYCENCDFYEEYYYDSCYGHEWQMEYVVKSNGVTTTYHRCYRCNAYTGEFPMPIGLTDVMQVYAEDGSVKIAYLNRNNAEATEIDATYELVLFLKGERDQWGNPTLSTDADGVPVTETLDGIAIDDRDGALTLSKDAVVEAIGDRADVAAVCLAVTNEDGNVTYIAIIENGLW